MKMWICRSPYGFLALHRKKPRYEKVSEEWVSGTLMTQCIHPEDFPEVTFENSPMEVELKLIEK